MKKTGFSSAVLGLALLLAGCFGVDYVGQNFPSLPENMPVLIFDEKNQPPAGEYQAIGRAVLTIPHGYGMVEVREKIAGIAREHGASAARIISVERLEVTGYTASGEHAGADTLASRRDIPPVGAPGNSAGLDSFGQSATPNRVTQKRYKHIAKVQFLMTVQDYNRAVEIRRAAAQKK